MADGRSALLPTGVVTLLFTDIEGSTRLAHELDDAWIGVLRDHHRLLRETFATHGGVEVSTAGDSFFVAFADAADAIAAAAAMQRVIGAHDWSPHSPVRVRMGLHTGEPTMHDADYAGIAVHAASRVESAAAGGQVLLTETTLAAAGSALGDADVLDLGMHRLKDLPAEVHLFQLVAEGLARDFPPVRSLAMLRNNVPVPPSSFVGRGDDLAALHRLLDSDRLVTLVGSGGAGKTRLALKVAAERLHRHRDGVWFVELDPAADTETVTGAVADAMGLREASGRDLLTSLVAQLRDHDVLLVLDNCEHVIDAAAVVTERLLRAGPEVRVVATAREPLAIAGERIWAVTPLSTDPDPSGMSEAVRLLVDRVQLVLPGFELADELRAHIEWIALRLDGLPLAIELAAASASMLSLDDIARQLDDRFALLTRGNRTALDRQKTLWGAIDWSYELLTADEQALLCRLGVFPGDFDIETVSGVLANGLDITAGISALATKSLLAPTPAGRWRMLDSIRAYARERLQQSGEQDLLEEGHARWFAGVVLDPDAAPASVRELDDLGVLHEDLVSALLWMTDHEASVALELLHRLGQRWGREGRWTEGRALGERVLAATTGVQSQARLASMTQVAELALSQSDAARARQLFSEVVDLKREMEGDDAAQVVLADLGSVAVRQGDLDTAEELYERALEIARKLDSPRETAVALSHLGEISRNRGEVELAWQRGSEALELARVHEIHQLVLPLVNLLGTIAHARGDLGAARDLYAEALTAAREAHADGSVIYLLFCMATLALDAGDHAEAAGWLAEGIRLGRDADAKADLAESLEAVARLAAERDEVALGCRLLAVVDDLRVALEFPRPPAEAPAYDANIERLRARCGVEFDQHWADGRSLPLDQAIAAALAFLG